jgi:hypothetical protein
MIIASCYYDDMNRDVVNAQKSVILPMIENTDIGFIHYRTTDHAQGMTELTRKLSKDYPHESVLWLDIDCVPTSKEALIKMSHNDDFCGCVQRANHIDNDGHLYVSPFCMYLPLETYREIGEPDFRATSRADVGEELTYILEATDSHPSMSYPTHCVEPMWDLRDGIRFGLGTTYDNGFYHNFFSRDPKTAQMFITKCEQICDSIK